MGGRLPDKADVDRLMKKNPLLAMKLLSFILERVDESNEDCDDDSGSGDPLPLNEPKSNRNARHKKRKRQRKNRRRR